jgi:transcriptional regulator with XRE-family HTH domain
MLSFMGSPDHIDPVTKAIAQNMRRLRTERGWSIQKLADEAGVHKNTIARLERLEQTLDSGTLSQIASALEVDVRDLVAMAAGETSTKKLIEDYERSPWAQIDLPTPDELNELGSPAVARWLGGNADSEGVHYVLLALRRKKNRGASDDGKA